MTTIAAPLFAVKTILESIYISINNQLLIEI